MKIFKGGSNDETTELRSPFAKLVGGIGEEYQVDSTECNYIIFMISGEVEVINNKNARTTMGPDYMYTLCKLCAPFSLTALSDFNCLVFNADTLTNHVNAKILTESLAAKFTMCEGLPELPYNDVFKSFIQNILLVNDCSELIPESFYDIKKAEFLHYMTSMYSYEQIVSFAYGVVSTYSDFKREVYAQYTNSINVEELAESMHMTTKTFTRNFKREFNMTPYDWILEQRLFNINHYILNKGMPLPKLMDEFDFSSASAMRQFLRRHDFAHLLSRI